MSQSSSMNTAQTTAVLPKLSNSVKAQLADVLVDLQDITDSGYRTYDLLSMIGKAVNGLGDEQVIPDLELMNIQNAVALAKRAVRYSKGWALWLEALYHVMWIAVWTVAIMYRSNLFADFHAGPILHITMVGAVSGAVGASLRALGALYIHRLHLDLDERFTMWYVLKPVVGGVMGSFVALMAGLLLTGLGGSETSPAVVLLSAFGGMHEVWAMGLFEKYTEKVLGKNDPSVGGQNSPSA